MYRLRWYCWAILNGGRFGDLRTIYQGCRALPFALARLSCFCNLQLKETLKTARLFLKQQLFSKTPQFPQIPLYTVYTFFEKCILQKLLYFEFDCTDWFSQIFATPERKIIQFPPTAKSLPHLWHYQTSTTVECCKTTELDCHQKNTGKTQCRIKHIQALKACFHYGCAWRCVARDIETPTVFPFLSLRNATLRIAQQQWKWSPLNKLEICVFTIAAIASASLAPWSALKHFISPTIARHATQRAAVMETGLDIFWFFSKMARKTTIDIPFFYPRRPQSSF